MNLESAQSEMILFLCFKVSRPPLLDRIFSHAQVSSNKCYGDGKKN